MTNLTAGLDLAQSTVSAHLACLRDCGLVTARSAGRASVYSLAEPALLDLLAAAENILAAAGKAVALCPVYGRPVDHAGSRAGPAAPPRVLAGMREHHLDDCPAATGTTAGILAASIALTGFSLDSVIECFTAAIVIWELRGHEHDRQARGVRLIAVTFFALAAYLTAESISDQASHAQPGHSLPGWPSPPPARHAGPGRRQAPHRPDAGRSHAYR